MGYELSQEEATRISEFVTSAAAAQTATYQTVSGLMTIVSSLTESIVLLATRLAVVEGTAALAAIQAAEHDARLKALETKPKRAVRTVTPKKATAAVAAKVAG